MFAISTLEACQTRQTDLRDQDASFSLPSINIRIDWLALLGAFQSAWLSRVLQNEAPSGTVLLHLGHDICVSSVWVCLRVWWNLPLTQLCIHMWSVFLSRAPDTLFLYLNQRVNNLIMQQRQCPVLSQFNASEFRPPEIASKASSSSMGSHYMINYKCGAT